MLVLQNHTLCTRMHVHIAYTKPKTLHQKRYSSMIRCFAYTPLRPCPPQNKYGTRSTHKTNRTSNDLYSLVSMSHITHRRYFRRNDSLAPAVGATLSANMSTLVGNNPGRAGEVIGSHLSNLRRKVCRCHRHCRKTRRRARLGQA